jgi:hypothetical protein
MKQEILPYKLIYYKTIYRNKISIIIKTGHAQRQRPTRPLGAAEALIGGGEEENAQLHGRGGWTRVNAKADARWQRPTRQMRASTRLMFTIAGCVRGLAVLLM